MVVVVLSGGLGNQMFQYAFFAKLKKNSPDVVLNDYSVIREKTHNGYELERLFGVKTEKDWKITLVVRIIRKILLLGKHQKWEGLSAFLLKLTAIIGITIVKEKRCSTFDQYYLKKWPKKTYLFGYWQTEKYFYNYRDEILSTFSFNPFLLSEKSKAISREIIKEQSVSIHVRRGDYLAFQDDPSGFSAVCSKEYYEKAISIVQSQINSPRFFIFSDDIEWTKVNFLIPDAIYINWNLEKDSWQDMYLMSICKHNIIANSTFSWWGAWLNTNPSKIVICPVDFWGETTTPDILAKGWIGL